MLTISDDLELPLDAVTQTFGIIAKRGSGKTYTGKVFAEELLENNMHLVVIDPIGVWWGLRASADGKKGGLPIIIAGGDHADIPLGVEQGDMIANLVIDEKVSLVIDLSQFRKGEQVRFMTDFAETLYHKNRAALHLLVDEADAFAPQQPQPGQQRLLGAMEDIVRRGRARGIGVTMITQRPSVINKNVLTQIEVLIALQLTAPLDRKAVDEWVKSNAEEGQREEFMGTLSSLPIGTAWFWSPSWLKVFKKVKVRKLRTLDSSATPKVGEQVTAAKVMAKVDIDRLKKQFAAVADNVKANDPKVLREMVTKLKSQLEMAKTEIAELLAEEKPQVVGVASNEVLTFLSLIKDNHKRLGELISEIELKISQLPPPKNVYKKTFEPGKTHPNDAAMLTQINDKIDNSVVLRKGEIRMLEVLGRGYPLRFTVAQMASLAKMKVTGGTFKQYYGNLKRNHYIEESDGLIFISRAGLGLLGISVDQPPKTKTQRITMWQTVLRAGERKIFDYLLTNPSTSRYNLAEATEFTADGGTFKQYIGNLRRNGLLTVDGEQINLAEDLRGYDD